MTLGRGYTVDSGERLHSYLWGEVKLLTLGRSCTLTSGERLHCWLWEKVTLLLWEEAKLRAGDGLAPAHGIPMFLLDCFSGCIFFHTGNVPLEPETSLPDQGIPVLKSRKVMAVPRGSPSACLLWILLLWGGDGGCHAQRAGGTLNWG